MGSARVFLVNTKSFDLNFRARFGLEHVAVLTGDVQAKLVHLLGLVLLCYFSSCSLSNMSAEGWPSTTDEATNSSLNSGLRLLKWPSPPKKPHPRAQISFSVRKTEAESKDELRYGDLTGLCHSHSNGNTQRRVLGPVPL